ncbi:MAG: hypothetical protein QME92_03450, partial [Bacillota bacterium]|nr:hypothetical protein [Bacillota bacterium]
LGDGPNLYAYCYQNPLRYVDPAGLRPLDNPGGAHDDPETDEQLGTSTDWMTDTLLDYDEQRHTHSLSPDSRLVELERTLSRLLSEAVSVNHRSADDLQLALLMATGVVVHDSGKQHGSPEHWGKIAALIAALKASGQAVEIWVNKSMSTVTSGLVNCLKRPDVTARLVDGSYKAIELLSPSQTEPMLYEKLYVVVQECGPHGITVTVQVIRP